MDLDDGITLRAADDPTIRDAFLPDGEGDARDHVFSAVQFLLTSNL